MKDRQLNGYMCELGFGTPAYAESIALRQKILRTPLGLTFHPEDLIKEWNSIHVGYYSRLDELWGCLVLHPLDSDTWKMRQVAVDELHQGKGIGQQLVHRSEIMARCAGISRMILHARNTAIPFYQRLAYQTEGEPFIEVGLPHARMAKNLKD